MLFTYKLVYHTITNMYMRQNGNALQYASEELRSEQFWMYLNLDMVAPQTFARTFTKPGSRLY